ncbi:MAG: methyltransferase domain-containing protein [Oligoflexia bacterium]|nr:methyltransferase domain-containing protein [Oligoflexia bacterium]
MRWSNYLSRKIYQSRGYFLYRVYDFFRDKFLKHETRQRLNPEDLGFCAHSFSTYIPSDWWSVHFLLTYLPIKNDDVFIDIGCGKGRVLRILSKRKIPSYGIELIPELGHIAKKNASALDVLIGDARNIKIPDDVTVIYLFNPFSWKIFLPFLNQIEELAKNKAHGIRIIYHGPVYHDLLIDIPEISDITSSQIPSWMHNDFKIYHYNSTTHINH